MVKILLIVELVPKLTPPASVTLLNVIVPETVADPANATVPLPAVKVPLLVREPPFEMVSVLGVESEAVNIPPLLIVKFVRAISVLSVIGAPEAIVARFVDADGAVPPSQLAPTFQLPPEPVEIKPKLL
jgi:hypothetical protein